MLQMKAFVTPTMTGEEVVEVIASVEGQNQDDREKFLERFQGVWPEAALQLLRAGVDAETACRQTSDQKVEYAAGDSDADSVRDYDSGPGKVRWQRRRPYWYRRDTNENDLTYRRRMKPQLRASSAPQLSGQRAGSVPASGAVADEASGLK